jgi:hypothetical protein
MPSDQRVGLDDGEGISPIEETREAAQSKTNGVCSAAGFDPSFNIKTKLSRRRAPNLRTKNDAVHASKSCSTLPATSVSRKSRPLYLYVSFL